jgi:hypothetical protein
MAAAWDSDPCRCFWMSCFTGVQTAHVLDVHRW